MKTILYLFVCYKNFDIVNKIISKLDHPNSLFLIHVDAYSNENISSIKIKDNIHITTKRFSTPWGGPELVFAILESLKESQKWNWDYVCLLSESDYPVKSPEYIAEFLHLSNKDHILINPLPCCNPLEIPKGRWLEGGRRRTECYAVRLNQKNIATIEPKKLNIGNIRQFIKIIRFAPAKLLGAFKILFFYKKRTTNILPCGGHLWFMLKRNTINAILEFITNNPNFIEYSKDTQCLDEIFFPTLVNQVITDKTTISGNIHRFISWEGKGSSSPRDLTIKDAQILKTCINETEILFVRKITNIEVCELIDNLRSSIK